MGNSFCRFRLKLVSAERRFHRLGEKFREMRDEGLSEDVLSVAWYNFLMAMQKWGDLIREAHQRWPVRMYAAHKLGLIRTPFSTTRPPAKYI